MDAEVDAVKAGTKFPREGWSKLEPFFWKSSIRCQDVVWQTAWHGGFSSLKPLAPLYQIIPVTWLYKASSERMVQYLVLYVQWNCHSPAPGIQRSCSLHSNIPAFPRFNKKVSILICTDVFISKTIVKVPDFVM